MFVSVVRTTAAVANDWLLASDAAVGLPVRAPVVVAATPPATKPPSSAPDAAATAMTRLAESSTIPAGT